LYVLDLATGEERRLTDDPHYDGWPSWSPDGRTLVFASMREGDLDIFTLDLASGEATNLTPGSKAHEYQPSYAPDGQSLLYISTRRGEHDLFRLAVGSDRAEQITTAEGIDETAPHWAPDGRWVLVLAQAELERYVARLDVATGVLTRLTWTRGESDPVLSPGGREIAWADRRASETAILSVDLGKQGLPHRLAGGLGLVQDLAWVAADSTLLQSAAARVPQEADPPTLELPPAPGSGLVEVPNLDIDRPLLNAAVQPSYQVLRERVRTEVGYDFLGRVSETHRPLHFASSASDYLSWHKAGRAVDTLLDLGVPPSQLRMEVVRDDRHNEVFWRIYLQCIPRDGSCGEPLLDRPWDFSARARRVESPGKGGHPSSFFPGYWFDFTAAADDFGWFRIASYQDPDFDWRTDKTALEFWHYQMDAGLDWWSAMKEIYDAPTLADWFSWKTLEEHHIPLWLLRIKGVPIPPELRARPVDLVVP
ncbi:MAG TPA: hypothetical protein DEP84_23230, partial [Chloroflexi bacterium]|nr:hypothetical protein [Chloroflexota bacterium]